MYRFSQERQTTKTIAARSSRLAENGNMYASTGTQNSPSKKNDQETGQTFSNASGQQSIQKRKINWVSSNQNPATPPYIVSPKAAAATAQLQPVTRAGEQLLTSSQVLWLKNQLVRLFELSEAPSWLCTLPTRVGTPGPSPGVLALGPPPPRRGLAMRPKGLFAKLGWAGAAPRPRVEPCLAASRRSLTARSCDSNLGRC